VVGYQLLTGQKPFDAQRNAGSSEEVPAIRSVNPQISAELQAVIERAMLQDPERRFRDADEFAAALDAAAEPDDSDTLIATSAPPIIDEDRTIVARVAPSPPREPVPVAVPVSHAPPAAAPPRAAEPPLRTVSPRRKKNRGWLVALPLLLLGGVAGLWALNQDGGGEPDPRPAPTDSVEARPAPDEPRTEPFPVDTGTTAPIGAAPVDDGTGEPQFTPVPINPDAGGGNPPAPQPSPAPQPRQPSPQPQPQPRQPAPQPRPAPQRPQPRPQLPPQREAPRQPLPQPQPQPRPPVPQPLPQPIPQPLPPQPPPPTEYPVPRDTIVIPAQPIPPPE
jgi:hypothetical protein